MDTSNILEDDLFGQSEDDELPSFQVKELAQNPYNKAQERG